MVQNPRQDGCVCFGVFISIPFWCVCFGFLVVFFSITAAVVGLGLTGHVPHYATSILVRSKPTDPPPKAGNQRTCTAENISPGKFNEEKKSKCSWRITFPCTLLWSSMC